MGKKSVKLQEIRKLMAEYGATCIENIDIESLRKLREAFESLEDQRFEPYVEHLLSDIVMIALLGVLANANEWNEIAAFRGGESGMAEKLSRLAERDTLARHDTTGDVDAGRERNRGKNCRRSWR
jgi:hypothetical protein